MFKQYSSPNMQSKLFNRVGTRHFHVDAKDLSKLSEISEKAFSHSSFPSRTNLVLALVGGPQRDILPEAYEGHHPATTETPINDSFTSTALQPYSHTEAEDILNITLSEYSNIILELEEVVMVIDWDGTVYKHFDSIDTVEYQLEASTAQIMPSVPYEYHHGFNIPKGQKPVNSDLLISSLSEHGVSVGSLYIFEADGYLAYRTNSFITEPNEGETIINENKIFAKVLSNLGFVLPVRTTLERVVGIWRA